METKNAQILLYFMKNLSENFFRLFFRDKETQKYQIKLEKNIKNIKKICAYYFQVK